MPNDTAEHETPAPPETDEDRQARREAEQGRQERQAARLADNNRRAHQVARRGWRLERDEAAAAEKAPAAPAAEAKTRAGS